MLLPASSSSPFINCDRLPAGASDQVSSAIGYSDCRRGLIGHWGWVLFSTSFSISQKAFACFASCFFYRNFALAAAEEAWVGAPFLVAAAPDPALAFASLRAFAFSFACVSLSFW